MPEPSFTDPSKLKEWLTFALSIGAVAVVPARALWNFGSGINTRVKRLEEFYASASASIERQEKLVSEFKTQAALVLERLETATNAKMDKLDDGQTANLQAMASLSSDVKNISSRLERVEEKCLTRGC